MGHLLVLVSVTFTVISYLNKKGGTFYLFSLVFCLYRSFSWAELHMGRFPQEMPRILFSYVYFDYIVLELSSIKEMKRGNIYE